MIGGSLQNHLSVRTEDQRIVAGADMILLEAKTPHWPWYPFRGLPEKKQTAGLSMAELTKEEVEKLVEDAVLKSMKGVFAVGLSDIVQCAVKTALDGYQHECVFDFTPGEVETAQTLMDVIKATGHGSITSGIEEVRENHVFTSRLRKNLDKVCDAVTSAILKAVMTVVLTAAGIGLVYIVSKNGGGPSIPPTP